MDVALVNDGPVTLEINTDPPPMDLPPDTLSTSLRTTMDMDELGSELTRISAEFKLPPELLE